MDSDREEQLREIDEYIKNNGVTKGPTAFVCTTIHAVIPPDRKFSHSHVKHKRNLVWPRARGKRK